MLSAKPWTLDEIVRLVLGAFICLCIGSLVFCAWHYAGPKGTAHLVLLCMAGAAIVLLSASLILITKPWKIEDMFHPLLLLMGCLSAGLCLAFWAQRTANLPPDTSSGEQMVIAEGAFLVFVIGFLRARQVKWADAFGLHHYRRQAVVSGIVLACIFLPVAEGLQRVSAHLMTNLNLEPQEQEAVHALRITSAWQSHLMLAVLALFLAPVAEEIFFRGMLYAGIKQAGFPRLATWGVSLFFAVVHFNLVSFVPLFVLAILLTALYERTDNLLACIAAHALFNGLNFALFYLFGTPSGK